MIKPVKLPALMGLHLPRENDSPCLLAYRLHLVRHPTRVANVLCVLCVLCIQSRFIHSGSDLRGLAHSALLRGALQDLEGLPRGRRQAVSS